MKQVNYITLEAAFKQFKGERKVMPLSELQELCIPPYTGKRQGWRFYGDQRIIKRLWAA